jgi:hypothetical protein
MFSSIDVGWTSIPSFADLDGDGDLDLLVGGETGSESKYYTNDGSNVFTENTTTFSGVTFPNYGRPTLADIDNDGDCDLIIGDGWGKVFYYRNDGNASTPVWVRADEMFAGIEVDQNAHPGFADLDNDGRRDLIIGEYNGNFTYYKNLFAPITNIEDGNILTAPTEFVLYQNYPNPFNPSTKIRFTIPSVTLSSSSRAESRNEGSRVQLKVFDILGSEIATLVNEEKPAGTYEVDFSASKLSSGVYIYTLKVNEVSYSKSMILLR